MSGDGGRAHRLAASMQAELAEIVLRLVKDPRVHGAGLLTITRVQVTEDCRSARVYVSFVAQDKAKAGGEAPVVAQAAPAAIEAAMKGLLRSAGFLRGELARRLSLRRAPDLRFVHDRTGEASAHIDALLKDDVE